MSIPRMKGWKPRGTISRKMPYSAGWASVVVAVVVVREAALVEEDGAIVEGKTEMGDEQVLGTITALVEEQPQEDQLERGMKELEKREARMEEMGEEGRSRRSWC